jgi:transcriptional regulator with XRE-family HTH domain
MNDHKSPKTPPYQTLGTYLRTVRQKVRESVAEVSGAVEIDSDVLERIEQGIELPSEDILMLLISHFGLGDDEAVNLWELAGYEQHGESAWEQQSSRRDEQQPQMTKQPVVLLALDTRVVYSNGLEVVSDKSGVVMNFTQYVDQAQGNVPISRVGMSYEQAEQVLDALQRALLRSKYAGGPKGLPEQSKRKPETDV